MADLGNTSQAHTAHKHRTTSWIAVGLMVVASIVIGVAFILPSVALGIVGGVIGLVGLVMAFAFNIMEDAY